MTLRDLSVEDLRSKGMIVSAYMCNMLYDFALKTLLIVVAQPLPMI